MFFTVFIFFQKFALILFLTIIQAFLGSFVVFLAMADSVGPSQPTYLVDRCLSMITNKHEQEEDVITSKTETTKDKNQRDDAGEDDGAGAESNVASFDPDDEA